MTTRKLARLAMGVALYAVLGMTMNIPLLAGTHLQTDLGYAAFGAFCLLFGWQAFVADTIPMLVGLFIGYRVKPIIKERD